jgi:ferric-dicitrate binding protein FerR (iron transport regulator)
VGPYQIDHIGTVFSVRLDEGLPLVTVKEGSVLLSNDHLAHVDLKAGRQARVTAREGQISIVVRALSDGDILNQLSWVGGKLRFESETAAHMSQEINRYNATQIEVIGSALQGFRFGGAFDPSDPTRFVATLSDLKPGMVECRLDGNFLRVRESTHLGHSDLGWQVCITK